MKAYERFIKYTTFDTSSSSANENKTPSSIGQREFAEYLLKELKDLGVNNSYIDDKSFVYAEIAATKGKEDKPKIGFIAHLDTVEDVSGKDIKANIIKNYDGKDIVLNKEKNIIFSVKDFPSLNKYKGYDLIVTDGTTLLGADDKAGIAEIMTMVETIMKDKSIEHGEIKIAFTPDEEIGSGIEYFNVEGFGADFAYTIDGGELGEIEYENFNAASCNVIVNGVNVHPGYAKNKMKNAILLAMEFNNMLPQNEKPEYTENYEGFYHLSYIEGNEENAKLEYIIRDHDREKFENKKKFIKSISEFLNKKYGKNTFEINIKDSYYNMKEKILPHMHLIENAKMAFNECGIKEKIVPIRGGTDGARLSFRNLPCPNLSAGGENFHSRFEYIPVQSLEKMTEVLLKIIDIYSK
ncbi:peptidase T [Brachyspira pilosicoli]|uniref:peptidase T n=1 Tax=Brachyspira pilosicoli TaxID=52584 RepID=UPI001CA4FA83|nr:peptidase T [Brachyspira pilosicoli]MBW5397100.1 peptidase T [Brachyspira pilosicoli]